MCRWLAYSGSSIPLDELLYKPEHSLIDQSLHARLGVETTNGDGFGVGWYGGGANTPVLFRSIVPIWNDHNLREISARVQSPLFLAHVRASTGTAVQQTNCHPFRYGRWLWVHNGLVREFPRLKRALALAIDESLYACIEGSTDSELLFYLALTLGLEDDPPRACGRFDTRARGGRGRCTTAGTCARCGSCIRSAHSCTRCPTRRASSSRSRSSISPKPGMRCRSQATVTFVREGMNYTRSTL